MGTADLLARRGDALNCDLLVAPHHGGTNLLLGPLLDRTSPTQVVISAGRRFPIAATQAELVRRAIPAWLTASQGAMRIDLESKFSLKGEPLPGR